MEIDKEDIIKAHDHSSNHYDEIITSEICGCFYCQETYKPSEKHGCQAYTVDREPQKQISKIVSDLWI